MKKFLTGFINVIKHFLKPFFPVKFYGQRKFEKKNTIFVGNHISAMDPILFTVYTRSVVPFVYKAELRKHFILRKAFDALDFVPVKRGEVDINATKNILRLLNNKMPVGLFPEGTRNPEVDCLQEFKTGAALFALKTKSPIRPFYIWDKTKIFHKNYYIVGDEFTLEEFYDQPITKELLIQATEKIYNAVDNLRLTLNETLAKKGIKHKPRSEKDVNKIINYNAKQKTLAKELARKQEEQEKEN